MLNIFDTIEIAFLPIGRTRENIDQGFSCISECLSSNQAITLLELHHELSQTYNQKTTVSDLKYVASWSGLREQEKSLTEISGLLQYRYFCLKKLTFAQKMVAEAFFLDIW